MENITRNEAAVAMQETNPVTECAYPVSAEDTSNVAAAQAMTVVTVEPVDEPSVEIVDEEAEALALAFPEIRDGAIEREKIQEILNDKRSITLGAELGKLDVPEMEQADESGCTDLDNSFAAARSIGLFSPAAGMACIEGVFDNSLYAAIYVDEKKKRIIRFCQKHISGDFGGVVEVDMATLGLIIMGGAGNKKGLPTSERNAIKKSLAKIRVDYLNTFDMESICLDIPAVLMLLCKVHKELPKYVAVANGNQIEVIYAELMDQLKYLMGTHNRFSYIAVTKDSFDYAARQMGWQPLKLLKLLDENRLLERQKSNGGYQMKVRLYTDKDGQRFDGDSEWCYCIKNIEAIGKTYVPEEHPLTVIDAKKLLG